MIGFLRHQLLSESDMFYYFFFFFFFGLFFFFFLSTFFSTELHHSRAILSDQLLSILILYLHLFSHILYYANPGEEWCGGGGGGGALLTVGLQAEVLSDERKLPRIF